MKTRVVFTLSMPSSPSWNGRWSGEGRNYNVVRSLSKSDMKNSGISGGMTRWYHRWDDGWCACIEASIMGKGERRPPSDGFNGYEWMVSNIIDHGNTRELETFVSGRSSDEH